MKTTNQSIFLTNWWLNQSQPFSTTKWLYCHHPFYNNFEDIAPVSLTCQRPMKNLNCLWHNFNLFLILFRYISFNNLIHFSNITLRLNSPCWLLIKPSDDLCLVLTTCVTIRSFYITNQTPDIGMSYLLYLTNICYKMSISDSFYDLLTIQQGQDCKKRFPSSQLYYSTHFVRIQYIF